VENVDLVAVVWVVTPCGLIALMMEAANASETSVNFYQTTRRNKSEDSRFHTRRRENLKSHFADEWEAGV
jgi:hypothetical protein